MPGLRLTFPKAEINLSTRIQIRYAYRDFEGFAGLPDPTPSELEDKGSFHIPRLRIKGNGWIYTKELTWDLEWDVAAEGDPLRDADIDYDFTGGRRALRLKAGQFKVPFSQQHLASSGTQQFVERSLLDEQFAHGRDIGVQLWGQWGTDSVPDLIDWRAGLFNGAGRNRLQNDNDEFQTTARIAVSPWGSAGFSESNLEGYEWRLSAAVGYNRNNRIVQPPAEAATGSEDITFTAAVVLKAWKSFFAYAEYYGGSRRDPEGVRIERNGWIAQAGWLITPKWEIAGRYAEYDPDTGTTAGNNSTEKRGAVSYYIQRHNWKIQADYGIVENETVAATVNRKLKEFRLQAQLIF